MSTIIDSYSESNTSAWFGLGNGGHIKSCQSFTGDGKILEYCKFCIWNWGSPTGNVVVKVYAHTGMFGTDGKPTGSALATSEVIDASTLNGYTADDETLETFIFSGVNKIKLENDVKYCLVIEYDGGTSGVDMVMVSTDLTSPSHSGNASYYTTSWTAITSYDTVFYVYGTLIVFQNKSKNSTALTNRSKNSTALTNKSKESTSLTNKAKVSTSLTNKAKVSTSFTNRSK